MKSPAIVLVVLLTILAIPAGTSLAQSGTVTVDATRTPLSEILSILAAKSDLNIVTSPEVENRQITIHLKNTPIDEALNLVVRAAGLGYEKIGNSILVGDPTTLGTETGLSTYVIDVKYADAFELEPIIAKIADKVATDPSGNKLMVVASPGGYEQVLAVMRELDVAPVQILLETEVIEVQTDDLLEYGIDWSKILHQTVIISETQPSPTGPGELPDDMPWLPLDSSPETLFRQARLLEVALDFLEDKGKAHVISRSTLATLNNRTAEIHIGDVIPYTVSGLTQTGLYEVSVEKERVGVQVSVTPRLSGDGFITALVEPNVSNIVGFKGPNDEIPWTKERRASTTVRVQDGQPFMIAGLLAEFESTETVQVPFLGDIPIVGYLFKHVRKQTTSSDLIIKVTPTIISQ